MNVAINSLRVLSGMRPTGACHIGHFHGALKNWIDLQRRAQCFFFVADWHALTTHYEDRGVLGASVWDMLIDWLAAGIDPQQATIFIQSRVPAHAELFLLLAMVTPVGWLERVPTYKDQIEKLKERDLGTYGFLGYPLMQAADILIYRANSVPVGEDQVPHIEITREIARRFNHLFGREANAEQAALAAAAKMGAKVGKHLVKLKTRYQQSGGSEILTMGKELIASAQHLGIDDRERLVGWFEGRGRAILIEPEVALTQTPKLPGLDGQKMSKSYGNAVLMRESPKVLTDKIRRMSTDPARVRRTDKGDPEKCPVWRLHQVYTDATTHQWVQIGCRSAAIGCLECKQPLIDAMVQEQAPWHERAQRYLDHPGTLRDIVDEGCDRARKVAEATMADVREAVGLGYR